MTKTIANMFKEEGQRRGIFLAHQNTLVRLMTKRFRKVARKVETRIRATTDVSLLETWLDNVVEAQTLAEVGVPFG